MTCVRPTDSKHVCAELLVTNAEFSELFWTRNVHGVKLAADLKVGVYDMSKKPTDRALVHSVYARGFFSTLKLVAARQLKLDLSDKALTRGRLTQVRTICGPEME